MAITAARLADSCDGRCICNAHGAGWACWNGPAQAMLMEHVMLMLHAMLVERTGWAWWNGPAVPGGTDQLGLVERTGWAW